MRVVMDRSMRDGGHSGRRRIVGLCALFALFIGTGAGAADDAVSRSRFLMGTTCEIDAAGVDDSATGAAFAEIARVDSILSTWRDDSELARLNRSGRAIVSSDLFSLLRETADIADRTGGAFNPLVGPLIRLWDIRGKGAIPSEAAIAATMPSIRIGNAAFDPASREIALSNHAEFEEGGFGKGYAIDRAAATLIAAGAKSFLINFGGQLFVHGREPAEVAIAHPEDRFHSAVVVRLAEGSLSTSSGSEKSFSSGATRFSHIVDPRTGRALPPRGSASVIHERAFVADALSTALYVMGPDEGIRWANANGVAAIFLVPDGAAWLVMASDKAKQPGIGLRPVDAEFHIKGNPGQ